MLFDSWGGVLADGLFQQFSLAYTKKVVAGLTREHEGRARAGHRLHQGQRPVDWKTSRPVAATRWAWTGPWIWRRPGAAPATRSRSRATWIRWRFLAVAAPSARRRAACLDAFGPVGKGGHVFNLGHGISRFTPPEAVAELVDEVHQYSRAFHA